MQKVNDILERRSLQEARSMARPGKATTPTPMTRKAVQLELQKAYPLHTVRRTTCGNIVGRSNASESSTLRPQVSALCRRLRTGTTTLGKCCLTSSGFYHAVGECRKTERTWSKD